MRRTLQVLGLIGLAAAAGAAAVKRALHPNEAVRSVEHLPATVSQELRQALSRFEDRFGT